MKRFAEDIAVWLASVRLSVFTILVVVLVGAGAVILSPSLSTFIEQRREISELRESVKVHREAVSEIDAERAKWKDPLYLRAQARDRLFYVSPGEIQLSVIDDIVMPSEADQEPSAELGRIEGDWVTELVSSFLVAGITSDGPDHFVENTP